MLEVSWFLFTVASLLLIVTPGQDMVLVMSRSVAQGAAAGVGTAAGVSIGLVFAALTFVVKAPVGFFAGLLSGWLRARPGVLAWLYRSSGAVLVGLGIKLTFERRSSQETKLLAPDFHAPGAKGVIKKPSVVARRLSAAMLRASCCSS